jgi:hypothetical protein
VTVRGACYVTTEIRNTIISKNPGNDLSDQKFFSLTNVQLLNLIRIEVRPINRIDFFDYLTSRLKFEVPDNFQLTVLNFKKWFNLLSMYVYNFINRIDFLLEMKLDEKTIPMCSSKPDGLIHTFLQGVRPREFGMSVHIMFFVKDGNFKGIHEYIDEFMDAVNLSSKSRPTRKACIILSTEIHILIIKLIEKLEGSFITVINLYCRTTALIKTLIKNHLSIKVSPIPNITPIRSIIFMKRRQFWFN